MATPTLLYVTQVAPYRDGPAGVHGVLDQSATAVAQLAEAAGLSFHRVADVRDLDAAVLAEARVVALFTIGETPWSRGAAVRPSRRAAGRAHLGAGHPFGHRLLLRVGPSTARWSGPASTAIRGPRPCTLDVLDPDHPAVAHLGSDLAWHDEVYQFRDLRPDAQVLLAARPGELGHEGGPEGGGHPGSGGSEDGGGARVDGPVVEHPLSWCFTEGAGRVFSTSLGHFPHAWESTDYLRHLAGGLDWLGEAGPRPEPGPDRPAQASRSSHHAFPAAQGERPRRHVRRRGGGRCRAAPSR